MHTREKSIQESPGRKLMKLAAAVLTGDSVLNSVLTAVNRVLKVYCTTGVAP